MLLVFLSITGCAQQQANYRSATPAPSLTGWLGLGLDAAQAQREFNDAKFAIEDLAHTRKIGFEEAARRIRNLDQTFAARRDLDARWKFDHHDEEFHAFSIAVAALVDKGRLSYAEYDAARTRRFSEIQARQRPPKAATATCITRIVGMPPFEQLQTTCR